MLTMAHIFFLQCRKKRTEVHNYPKFQIHLQQKAIDRKAKLAIAAITDAIKP